MFLQRISPSLPSVFPDNTLAAVSIISGTIKWNQLNILVFTNDNHTQRVYQYT